jgi:hypothetical protein
MAFDFWSRILLWEIYFIIFPLAYHAFNYFSCCALDFEDALKNKSGIFLSFVVK